MSGEWAECFGAMDADIAAEVTAPVDGGSAAAVSSAGEQGQLRVLEPQWFLQCDEVRATECWAADPGSRLREVNGLRHHKAALLFSQRCFDAAIDAMEAPQPAETAPALKGRPFHSTEQRLVALDVLGRCHAAMGRWSTALKLQREATQLRPSLHSLLLLARWLRRRAEAEGGTEDGEGVRERANVLLRCLDCCPVHAETWLELGDTFFSLSRHQPTRPLPSPPSPPRPPSSPAPCACDRRSSLHCALLCFALAKDLTAFALDPRQFVHGGSLSRSRYPAFHRSAARRLAEVEAAVAEVGAAPSPSAPPPPRSSSPVDGCHRCAAVCGHCWRPRLHRLACGPLLPLFALEREAEQRAMEGNRRKKGGRRTREPTAEGGAAEGDDGSDGEEAAEMQFDATAL